MNTKNHNCTWNLENLYIPLELIELVLIMKFDLAKERYGNILKFSKKSFNWEGGNVRENAE